MAALGALQPSIPTTMSPRGTSAMLAIAARIRCLNRVLDLEIVFDQGIEQAGERQHPRMLPGTVMVERVKRLAWLRWPAKRLIQQRTCTPHWRSRRLQRILERIPSTVSTCLGSPEWLAHMSANSPQA